jgi:hemerythrin-like metal-binding protein
MALIDWDERFRVGIAAVDHEHRELIGLINALHERLGGGYSVADFLGEIYARISAHFALEEKIMRERNYDQYDDHKTDHERLLDEIRDIMDDYEDQRIYQDEILAGRLRHWFGDHFRTRDARLHLFLAGVTRD